MATFVGVLAAFYLLAAGSMFLFQDQLLFLPDIPSRTVDHTPQAVGLAFEPLRLPTADGETLDAWFIPAPQPVQPRRVVLHFHGNAGNISHRIWLAAPFQALGLDLLLFDYRGYGRSTGKPSEQGTYRDAQAVWRYLVEDRGLAPSQVVLHGQSMGGAVAAWLAARTQPAALVLDSTFTSAPDLGAELYRWLPVRWLSRIRYDTRRVLADVRCPVLIAHSRDDEIVPFHHGEELFAAAREPRQFAELRGGHNEALIESEAAFTAAVAELLSRTPAAR